MSTVESKKHKKRRRSPDQVDKSSSAKKWSPYGAFASASPAPIFDDSENDSRMDIEESKCARDSPGAASAAKHLISLLELPIEVLWVILRFLDSDTAVQSFKSMQKLGIQDYGEIHRRDLLHVRATCTFLKDITISPFIWATHLLLRSGSFSLPSAYSMSPYLHTESTLRHVSTLVIVLEDNLSHLARDRHENIINLIDNSKIRSLILVRRSSASETFVRSPVVAEMTSVELLIRFLIEETAILLGLRRLTLVNVVLRPMLLQSLYNACRNLVKLDTYWSKVSMPRFGPLNSGPKYGESLLLSHAESTTSSSDLDTSSPSHDILAARAHAHGASRVFLSRESKLLLDFKPTAPLRLSRLHLSGPSAIMFSSLWISPLLRKLHLDFSMIDAEPNWERLQGALTSLPATCPLLASLSLYLGKNNSKKNLDVVEAVIQLLNCNLESLASDIPLTLESLPQLTEALPRAPNLQLLELCFHSAAPHHPATARSSTIAPIWNPLYNAPTTHPSLPDLLGTQAAHSLSVAPSSSFLPQPSHFASLASIFGSNSIGPSKPSALSSTAPVQPSILNTLSVHCPSLRRLRLTKASGKLVSEPWASMRFKSLTFLQYNLGLVPPVAFSSMDTNFPQLVHLDLSRAEMADASQSLSGLEKARGLQSLVLEGCNVDPKSLLPMFESRKASASLCKLDFRFAHPFGLDDLLLRRISRSCGTSLVHLAFSVAHSQSGSSIASVSHQAFSALLQQCKRLKTIQTSENSSIPSATADLIRQSGVEFLRS